MFTEHIKQAVKSRAAVDLYIISFVLIISVFKWQKMQKADSFS